MKILKEVQKIVANRQKTYSNFAETMELTAELSSQIIKKKISAADVALIYAVNKLVRHRTGVYHKDNLIDAISYLAIIDEIQRKKK